MHDKLAGRRRVALSDGRSEERVNIRMEGPMLREHGGTPAPVVLHDLSPRGFRTEWPYTLPKGRRVMLKIPGLDSLTAIVMWYDNFQMGCRFETGLHPAVLERIVKKNR